MPEERDLDILIVGAGVVGCAVAYALRDRRETVYWLEAAARPGSGMTSRNSGVIHAGIYYPADSLKTKLCRLGRQQLYDFAEKHKVPHQRTGKYLVANDQAQMDFLERLAQNNPEIPLESVRHLPVGIHAEKALYSPTTGVIDQHALIQALIAASGREPLYHQAVTQMVCRDDHVVIQVGDDRYRAKKVFNCTGLQATVFSQDHQHFMARGSYFQLIIPHDLELPHLVYPAVPKKSASLGIHLTRNLYGEAFLGPDLSWTETEHYGVDASQKQVFFQAAKTYLPWLELGMLQPGYAGIRAKLSRTQFSDFLLKKEGEAGQLLHFLGIESPGLTAALALGALGVAQLLTT